GGGALLVAARGGRGRGGSGGGGAGEAAAGAAGAGGRRRGRGRRGGGELGRRRELRELEGVELARGGLHAAELEAERAGAAHRAEHEVDDGDVGGVAAVDLEVEVREVLADRLDQLADRLGERVPQDVMDDCDTPR